MRLKFILIPLFVLAALTALYFTIVLHWSYASGDRAGWVQKLSNKGWLCKTWEGELVMVSMPGSVAEKFAFTVRDEEVAESLRKVIGKRVDLHYEQKVGLPTSCFGDTRYYVTGYTPNADGAFTPGLNTAPSVAPAAAAGASAPTQP
jgi:hypothetical protein